ncbi:hypothetical protein D3C84_1238880 [compost metagenome]
MGEKYKFYMSVICGEPWGQIIGHVPISYYQASTAQSSGITMASSVPLPGTLSTLNSPPSMLTRSFIPARPKALRLP